MTQWNRRAAQAVASTASEKTSSPDVHADLSSNPPEVAESNLSPIQFPSIFSLARPRPDIVGQRRADVRLKNNKCHKSSLVGARDGPLIGVRCSGTAFQFYAASAVSRDSCGVAFRGKLGSGLSRVCGGLAQVLNLLAQKLDLPLNKLSLHPDQFIDVLGLDNLLGEVERGEGGSSDLLGNSPSGLEDTQRQAGCQRGT